MRKFSGAYEYQAFRILQILFVIVSTFKGLDKILYYLTGWTFNSPVFTQFLQTNDRNFVLAIGIVEVIIGIGVIFKPKFFAYLLMVWTVVIIINFSVGKHYDIALREFVLFLSAFALAKLSYKYGS